MKKSKAIKEVAANPLGKALHKHVNSGQWCVTLEQLQTFKSQVKQIWLEGKIPEDADDPNPYHWDPEVGPNMYSVNQYFVKPYTSRNGGMSYALLCNPQGIECTVFVTPSWSEGVFEFVDRVTR